MFFNEGREEGRKEKRNEGMKEIKTGHKNFTLSEGSILNLLFTL